MEDTYKGQVDNPLSLNRYTYVHNNPLRFIDPSGHVAAEGSGGYFGGSHADLVLSWGEKAVTYADAHGIDYDEAVEAIVPAELKQEVHEVVYQIGATRTYQTAGDAPDLGAGTAGAGAAAAGAIKKTGQTASTGKSNLFGANGTQVTSKTVWKAQGSKARIDVENPNPGQGSVQYFV